MFLFCPNDGTLLLCEATPSTRFFCQTCSYTHAVTERITQVKKLTAKKITTVDNAASNAARPKTDSASLLLRSLRVCSRALVQCAHALRCSF
jgi:DNA-directed RNA polymerase subunit M/transcription elongation factor TFIIS